MQHHFSEGSFVVLGNKVTIFEQALEEMVLGKNGYLRTCIRGDEPPWPSKIAKSEM